MDEEEIETLISDLRALLERDGFAWAREDAEAALPPESDRRRRAHSLISAIESVTVDIARAEIAIYDELRLEEITFKPDTDGDSASADEDRPHGRQRRKLLMQLSELEPVLAELRARVDDDR